MIPALLAGLSGAALSIIARLISQKALEELLTMLLVKGSAALAAKTGNTVDDELAAFLAKQLEQVKPN